VKTSLALVFGLTLGAAVDAATAGDSAGAMVAPSVRQAAARFATQATRDPVSRGHALEL
jgi:hypothetical protein